MQLKEPCKTCITIQEGFTATEPEGRRIEGVRCESSADCQAKDVNLVCRCGQSQKRHLRWMLHRGAISGIGMGWLMVIFGWGEV